MPRKTIAALFLASCRGCVQKSLERCLRVDCNTAGARQIDDHVRTQAARITVQSFLFAEVTMLRHSGQLGHAPQRHLPPTPPDLRGTQGSCQYSGLLLQASELLLQRAIGVLPCCFYCLELRFIANERFLKRDYESFNRFLPLGQITPSFRSQGSESLPRQIEK